MGKGLVIVCIAGTAGALKAIVTAVYGVASAQMGDNYHFFIYVSCTCF